MDLPKQQEGWPLEWHMGILDIDRKTVLPNLATSYAFKEGVRRHAVEYMQMWQEAAAQEE